MTGASQGSPMDDHHHDEIGTSRHSRSSVKSNRSTATLAGSKIQPAPFLSLFRFAQTRDILMFVIGLCFCVLSAATMPAINIIFGDIVDAIAEPINVEELVNEAVRAMAVLGLYGFVTFFLSFLFCGYAAANVANAWRMEYLRNLLIQDMAFFDTAEPGSLTLMLSDSAMTIQAGLSDKFAQGVQGFFQFVFGFAIAFYFGPILTLVLLACVPVLGLVTSAMFFWGSEDGLYGKEAYDEASTIANEAISNIRTVASLNAEPQMSKRYDSKLGDSEKAAVRQGLRNALLTGALFFVIFSMYGLGFWFGSTLIADSIDDSMKSHPAPQDLLDPSSPWYPTIQIACSSYLDDVDTTALEVCACGLPWDVIDDSIPSPNCGCGYEQAADENLGADVLAGCVSGGRVMMVFFSILIGGFSVGQVGPGVKAMADARIAAAKILTVIDRIPDIGGDDGAFEAHSDSGNPGETTKSKKKKKRLTRDQVNGEIVFQNVRFQYTQKPKNSSEADQNDGHTVVEEDQPNLGVVFTGCNLTIKAGETVALVGESGCGKSTIAKLVQRFYDPTEGRILLDGTDLRDINVQDLRSCIGVVSQEPLLFDTTIEDNIRFGKPDSSFEDIVQAAEKANAHDFIMSFPEGYKTKVGPRGGKLSGGQKQRVAIARAILRDPPLLILDEATSALDTKSEKIVQQALDQLIHSDHVGASARSRTIIVVAHRLSTVRNADKIVVLGSPEGTSTSGRGSEILEQGTHEELLALEKGFYRALVGTGHASSTFSDDADLSRQNSYEDPSVPGVKINSTERQSTAISTDFSGEEDSSQKTLAGFFRKKDSTKLAKEAEEKKKLKENKARVWNYTKPELGWIMFGSTASILKGTILPLLSIVFSRMIVVWYNSDTDYMVDRSLQYSFVFYGLAVLSMVFEAVQKGVFEMIGERLTKRLRGDLFRSILLKDISWFDDEENAVGVLASRLSTDVKLVRLVAGQSIASTLESTSSLLTGIIISAMASWEMFLIMLAMVPALGTAEALQFAAMKSSEGTIRDQLSKSTDKLHETVSAIREVQSFSLQKIVIDDIESRINDTISPASRKAALFKGIMMGMIQLIQFLVYAFAFWMGGKLIARGRITFEDFNQSLWAMAFAASGLGQAALFAGDVAKATAAVTAVFATLDYVPEIKTAPWERNGIADLKTREPKTRVLPENILKHGDCEFSRVNFSYPTRKAAKVFDQIDLKIPSGKVVALVGSSGSGKSTVVQLIERFYDPISYNEDSVKEKDHDTIESGSAGKDGTVSIDKEDMRSLDVRWLRANVGYVGQEPVLFNDTIYNNIAVGTPGCTKDQVVQAAKNANAYNFIMGLDDGFDTMVGVGGGKISGGQKQRVAIARALMGNPKILIFDEATSALDNKSEKIVQASLDRLVKESGGSRTTIIIAHRLSSIRDADVICVLENVGSGSRVEEMGTHDELLQLGKKYKALVQAYDSN